MKRSGLIIKHIDLGNIGDQPIRVDWSGYRPAVPAEDDQATMEVTVTLLIAGKELDITSLICRDVMDDLRTECWDEMPSSAQAAAEAFANFRADQDERFAA